MRSRARAGKGLFTGILALASLLLAVEVVLLVRENRRLRAASTAENDRPAERPRLEPGDVLGSFGLLDGEGGLERVEFDGGFPWTLLFVFAEACPACPVVRPVWEELAPRCLERSVRVFGIRLDPDGGAAAAAEAAFPVLSIADAREVPLAELATVPATALLDGDGVVRWVRYGLLNDEDRRELLGFVDG